MKAVSLALIVACTACASSVRHIDVEGDSCERIKVIYDSDRKKVKGPGG